MMLSFTEGAILMCGKRGYTMFYPVSYFEGKRPFV